MYLRETKTENGRVRGIPAADPRITAFKGIPYAAPPVGNLRWKKPQPAENWEGVKECYTFANIAMQVRPGMVDNIYTKEWHVDPDVPMGEDCLHANIWTPAKDGTEKLPVMVWIYGGGLREGYPSEMEFDGERIARRGVVLVSINYRLSIFGFFAHPWITAEDPDFPTNFGHLDQKFGIEWVKRNIANFGGDPDNILVFGQSAGGGSTMAQVCSPLNKGLFHKAIIHSGGGLLGPGNLSISVEEAEKKGVAFFEKIGVKSLEEARAIPAQELYDLAWADKTNLPFSGTIIGDKFLPENPVYIFQKGAYNHMPMIIGNTVDEFPAVPPAANEQELAAFAAAGYGEDGDKFMEIAKKGAASFDDMKKNATYNMFETGNLLMCDVYAEEGSKEPLYFYNFDPEIPGPDDPGAFHSSDLWFVFETLAKCWRPFKGKHYDLSRQMCNYWTSFAKKGDPNCLDADGAPQPQWLPISKDQKAPMMFEDDAHMGTGERKELTAFMVDHYLKNYAKGDLSNPAYRR